MPIYVMTVNDPDHRLTVTSYNATMEETVEDEHECHCVFPPGVTPAVVRAVSEEEARQIMYNDYDAYINADGHDDGVDETDRDMWLSPEKTSAFRVTEEGESGIVFDAWLYY